MNLINYNQLIITENRQREEFDQTHIEDLARSIENLGLLHAPVVRDDGRTLVAGECRIRAMHLLHQANRPFNHAGVMVPPGLVPVVRVGTLSPEELEEAELDENIKRKDLT